MRDPELVSRLQTALYPVFDRHREIIAAYLFGSHATEEATSQSDIDLGVVFAAPPKLMEELSLEAEVCSTLGTDRVDLVNLNKARIGLQFRAIQSGARIYCADEEKSADFVEMVLDKNGDYGLTMYKFNQDFLEGLREARR
jgi:predicted nucleotidyltransferase